MSEVPVPAFLRALRAPLSSRREWHVLHVRRALREFDGVRAVATHHVSEGELAARKVDACSLRNRGSTYTLPSGAQVVVYTSPDLATWTFRGFVLDNWPTRPYGASTCGTVAYLHGHTSSCTLAPAHRHLFHTVGCLQQSNTHVRDVVQRVPAGLLRRQLGCAHEVRGREAACLGQLGSAPGAWALGAWTQRRGLVNLSLFRPARAVPMVPPCARGCRVCRGDHCSAAPTYLLAQH